MYDENRKGFGHQGVTKGQDNVWYVIHTRSLFRYESDDFSAFQKDLVRNEKPFDNPDFRGTQFDHLGAPEYYDGNVYTFAKVGPNPPVRLIWFDADNLSYQGYREISVPKAPDGLQYVVSGGPHIVGEFFYAALALVTPNTPEGKRRRRTKEIKYIAKFRFPSGEFVSFVELKGRGYFWAQGIDMDNAGNFYVVETKNGVHVYDSSGVDKGYLFRHPKGGIHEGFYFEPARRRLTISITRVKFYWITIATGEELNYPW